MVDSGAVAVIVAVIVIAGAGVGVKVGTGITVTVGGGVERQPLLNNAAKMIKIDHRCSTALPP